MCGGWGGVGRQGVDMKIFIRSEAPETAAAVLESRARATPSPVAPVAASAPR